MRRSQVCASRFPLSKTQKHATHNCRDLHHSWQARRPDVMRAIVLVTEWTPHGLTAMSASGTSRHSQHVRDLVAFGAKRTLSGTGAECIGSEWTSSDIAANP